MTINRPINFHRLMRLIEPYLFVGPGVLMLVLLMLVPIGKVVYDSLHAGSLFSPSSDYIGLENYYNVTDRRVFNDVIYNSVFFTIASLISHLVIGMALALALNRRISPVVLAFFRSIFILPWIFTAAVVALAWKLLLSPVGVVNYMLESVTSSTVEIDWLGDPEYAMLALIIINAWRGYPFVMVSILAGLQGIDEELYEAASIDGADSVRRFLYVTLPQLRPILLSVGLLDMIWTFNLFPLIWLTTGGGPSGATETVATFTYKIAFNEFEFGQASAMAVIAVGATLVITLFYLRYQKRY